MSTIVDVSGRLGEYMLKGWVLTDNICPKCSKVPLMRSPSSPIISFCANCDAGPPSAAQPQAVDNSGLPGPSLRSSRSGSSSSDQSRSSTPPTEISNAPSSAIFVPPIETEEMLRRRQQSDTASAEIGKRMLRGWAMLADECPNPTCYGIPLVRPPNAGTGRDPRKECVICGTVYVDQKDAFGQDRLVTYNSNSVHDRQPTIIAAPPAPQAATSPVMTRGKATQIPQPQLVRSPPLQVLQPGAAHVATTSTVSALDASADSLVLSLHALSERLNILSGGSIVDPSLIAQTADAISKVSQALTQVKQLQWSEHLAHSA
ncbi:predicted protein [Sparassis crispa]|uniref:Uncharacterized protein n=1 Tax=Sparassis crispa TaxID=139825 RepID=A0A401GAX6_9APHY|nr:predicted protein [Sparassis crispa]GBE79324.1 predicted protein [Sparassis crispa]